MLNDLSMWRRVAVTSLFALSAACNGGGKATACADACPTAPQTTIDACQVSYDACSTAGVPAATATACEDALTDALEAACEVGDFSAFDTDSPDNDRDTAPSVTYLRPSLGIILASFGYDSSTGEAVPYTFGTTTLNPSIGFVFANDNWDFANLQSDDVCQVELSLGGAVTGADYSALSGVVFGFEFASGTATGATDCDAKLDPDDWPDITASLAGINWGVAINEAIDPTYRDQLATQAGFTEDDFAELLGGGLTSDFGAALDQSGFFNGGLTSGSQVDENFNVILDASQAPTPMLTEEMVIGGELQNGSYTIQVGLPFDIFDQLL